MSIVLPPGGQLLGLGTDVIEIARVKGVYDRQGERFLHRVFTEEERRYCLGMKFPEKHLAARFAAKEAISKAFGTGIGAQLGWQDIEVGRKDSGEPFVILHGAGETLFQQRGGSKLHLTLSHTQQYATALAILEGEA
jgi:holo-[acyl-carrier protein] synthase